MSQSHAHSSDAVAVEEQRSQQLSALSKIGTPWPMFEDRTSWSAADALRTAASGLNNRRFLTINKGLVEYVQSGRMLDPAFAIPVPATLHTPTAGALINSESVLMAQHLDREAKRIIKPRMPLTSLRDLVAALFRVILPALEEQPLARAQWGLLTLNALEIEHNTNDWGKAKHYILETLRIKAETKEPFGKDDTDISGPILTEAKIAA